MSCEGEFNVQIINIIGNNIARRTLEKWHGFTEDLAVELVVYSRMNYNSEQQKLLTGTSAVTGIGGKHLNNICGASVATKMSCFSRREISGLEDMAYCLQGIFDISMPLLYGEERERPSTDLSSSFSTIQLTSRYSPGSRLLNSRTTGLTCTLAELVCRLIRYIGIYSFFPF